jgi:hypothetical protein
MPNTSPTAEPTALRRLDSPSAATLAELASMFEDLQMVLRCCERLVSELAAGDDEPDDVLIESVWTVALLSYARCFASGATASPLTQDDLTATVRHANVLDWHNVLLQLRDHYADPIRNPRERFSVGVAQDSNGAATAVALTSGRQPLVDDTIVRQTGAIAYALSSLLNDRIAAQQQKVFDDVKIATKRDLDKLEPLDIAEPEQAAR